MVDKREAGFDPLLDRTEKQSLFDLQANNLDATTELLGLIVDKGDVISEYQFEEVRTQLEDVFSAAHALLLNYLSTGATGFPGKLREIENRIGFFLDKLSGLRIQTPGGQVISVESLGLKTYFAKKLEARLFDDGKGRPVVQDFENAAAALQMLPVVQLFEEFTNEAKKLTPKISQSEIELQERAGLTEAEVDALNKLLAEVAFLEQAKAQNIEVLEEDLVEYLATERESFLKPQGKRQTQALKSLLETSRKTDLGQPEMLRIVPVDKLKNALEYVRKQFDDKTLMKKALKSDDIDENKPYKDRGLNKERVDEQIDVINRILDFDKKPQFTAWQEAVVHEATIGVSETESIQYLQFMAMIDEKIEKKVDLTEEDEDRLNQFLEYFLEQRRVVDIVDYDLDNSLTKKLKDAQKEELIHNVNRLRKLLETSERYGVRVEEKVEKEVPQVVKEIYEFLRRDKYNPDLPDLEKLEPSVETFHQFEEEFFLALFNLFQDKPLEISIASGGRALRQPSGTTSLYGMEIPLEDKTSRATLQYAIENFPWWKVIPNYTPEAKNQWIGLVKNRLLEIELVHNAAFKTKELLNKDRNSSDLAEKINNLITDEASGGPFQAWALDAFYSQLDVESPLYKALGEREKNWQFGDMTRYMEKRFLEEMAVLSGNGALSTQDTNPTYEQKVQSTKDLIYAELTPIRKKGKNGKFKDEKVLQSAWDFTAWKMSALYRLQSLDKSGLDSKFVTVFNLFDYAHKTISPHLTNTEQLTRPTAAEIWKLIPLRDEAIYFIVRIDDENSKKYTIEEIIDQAIDFDQRSKDTTLPEAKRKKYEGHAKRLTKMVYQARAEAVGPMQNLNPMELDGSGELAGSAKRFFGKLRSFIQDQLIVNRDKLIASGSQEAAVQNNFVRDYLKYEADMTEAYRQIQLLPYTGTTAHDKHDFEELKLAKFKAAALNWSINHRFKFVRFEKHDLVLDGLGYDDIVENAPIMLDKASFNVAQNRAIMQMNPDRAYMLPVSFADVIASGVKDVRWFTQTADHNQEMSNSINNSKWVLTAVGKISDRDGMFTDNAKQMHPEHVGPKTEVFLEPYLKRIKQFANEEIELRRKSTEELAIEVREYGRSLVHVSKIEESSLVKDSGDKEHPDTQMAKVTKSWRYALGAKMNMGPVMAGEARIYPTKVLSGLIRSFYENGGDNLYDLFNQTRDAGVLERAIQDAMVDPQYRMALDILMYEDGGVSYHQAAINTILAISTKMFYRGYLSQFALTDEIHGELDHPDKLHLLSTEINTPAKRYLNFEEEEFERQRIIAIFKLFKSPVFGADEEGFNKKLPAAVAMDFDGVEIGNQLLGEIYDAKAALITDLLYMKRFAERPSVTEYVIEKSKKKAGGGHG